MEYKKNKKELTPAQREVHRLVAQGLSNKEIAYRLTITPGTVSQHIFSIYQFLGITNRVQCALSFHGIDWEGRKGNAA